MANLFHTMPGLNYTVTDMDTVRLKEELNTALSRYCGPIICTVGDNMSLPVLCESLHLCFYQLAIEFFLRCRFAEEERNVLLQARKEMSDELKDVRRKLEESMREMEILKRKALRLEDENKHLVRITIKET